MKLTGIFLTMFVMLFASHGLCVENASTKADRPTPTLGKEWVLFDEGSIIDQVIMQSESAKVYDWRNAAWEIEFGVDDVNERNVFPSRGWHLGLGFPVGGGFVARGGVRRIQVSTSNAGEMIEKTPFRQVGQPTRWELYGLASYSLIEGRGSSRLSPWLSDVENIFSLELGAHFVHPSKKYIPTKKGERVRVPGQTIGVSVWVADVGFRYQFFLPRGIGFFVASNWQIPFTHIAGPLGHWSSFSAGTVVSFGNTRRLSK